MRSRIFVWLVVLGCLSVLRADPRAKSRPSDAVLQLYLARAGEQRAALRNVSMEVDIEANLPQLQKTGKLSALRHISKLGQVSYDVLSFIGDKMIKKDVIARYIAAEVKATGNGRNQAIAITEENYKFKYRGMYGVGDWRLHLFELQPRKKRVGLFRGWLWVEADSGVAVRESGRFVKSPSVFLKTVEFLRDYEIRDGMAVPVRVESTIRTRLVGTAKLSIRFGDVSFHGDRPRLAAKDMRRAR